MIKDLIIIIPNMSGMPIIDIWFRISPSNSIWFNKVRCITMLCFSDTALLIADLSPDLIVLTSHQEHSPALIPRIFMSLYMLQKQAPLYIVNNNSDAKNDYSRLEFICFYVWNNHHQRDHCCYLNQYTQSKTCRDCNSYHHLICRKTMCW